MKKKIILLPMVGMLLYIVLSSYSSGPSAAGDLTGAHGGSYCASGCHASSASSSTNVTIQLLSSGSPVTTYTPGGSYVIRFTGVNTGGTNLPYFGFQLSAVRTGTSTSAGTLSTSGISSIAHSSTPSGTQVIEHSSAIPATTLVGSGGSGTTYIVDIPWTAPATGVGCVTIYGVMNAINHNGSQDAGDLWNNTSLNVTEAMPAISGTRTVCPGYTTTLSNAISGGTWTSTNTSIASVGTSGIVTGVSAGTANISYATCAGNAGTTVTVNPAPTAILGTPQVCVGSSVSLSNITPVGTWASSNTTIATINSSGYMTGNASGTATISFTTSAFGCSSFATASVAALPSTIAGPASVCIGSSMTLSDATTGGTWASGNTNVSIGSSSGIVSGSTVGTSVVTYTSLAGCTVTTTITVNPLPPAITGLTTFCSGSPSTLSDANAGTWSSSNVSVANINSATGIIAGGFAGTANITFTNTNGCVANTVVTVNPLPATISGPSTACAGTSSVTLSDATGGGSWSSSNTSFATIGSSSGNVTAVAPGATVITYTLPLTGCVQTKNITVNPILPAIGGTTSVCPGLTTTLTESVGGTWASTTTSVATIGITTGFVTGSTAGTSVITFTSSTTGCIATETVTVNPLPSAITGTTSLCAGLTGTLSNGTPGGNWSSTSAASIGSSSGIVTAGTTSGTATISYTLPLTGCARSTVITITPLPSAIAGQANVCAGSTVTLTSTGSGTWSSSATGIATVGTGVGAVSGASPGTSTITYTLNGTGCFTTTLVTVNPLPLAISGSTAVCVSSATTLSDAGGGTWSSSASATATVSSGSGIVNGVAAGTSRITYILPVTGCRQIVTVTVSAAPAAITGTASLCEGASATLSSAPGGGIWSSNSVTNASIGSSTGIVSGILAGNANISYTAASGCSVIRAVTVNPTPSAIAGALAFCRGSATTLSDPLAGGGWVSSNTSVATITSGSGIVAGVTAGTSIITYSMPVTGCRALATLTVNAISPITGTTSLCSGLSSTLSDATIGGTWSSSTTSVATIGATSGFLNSVSAGTSIVTYTAPSGCIATTSVAIITAPSGTTGNPVVCVGTTTTLNNTGGGTWTSSNTTFATVNSSGVVTGVNVGTATITYSLGTGCVATIVATVNPAPSFITGTGSVCPGNTITLSHITSGGTWSSSNTGIVTVGSTGIVTGVNPVSASITYTLPNGCTTAKSVTVSALPSAITGITMVCPSATTTLSSTTVGGTWSISGTSASISSTGIVSGLSAGTGVVSYVAGCVTTTTVTVNPTPTPISFGFPAVCIGNTITLSDIDLGGTWSAASTSVSVGSTDGSVTGISTGTPRVTYTLPTGCLTTTTLTVNALPLPILGPTIACQFDSVHLINASTGGTWSSANTAIATVGAGSGYVVGVTAGSTDITYTLASGCQASVNVTVNPSPSPITGSTFVCNGETITLSGTGGTWSSLSGTTASVGSSTGIVSGLAPGNAVIAFTNGFSCQVTTTVTVGALPVAITGPTIICNGFTATLSDASAGGTWTSATTATAAIGTSSGIVSALGVGTSIITYTLPSTCFTTTSLTVNPQPAAILGISTLCAGSSATLSDATAGGSWFSASTATATVGSGTGVVSAAAAGTATIVYGLPTGCYATLTMTVNPLPAAISGASAVCAGATATLSNGTLGGTWTSSTTSVATIGSGSGIASGTTAGTTTVTYRLSTGCLSSHVFSVNPLPAAISGATSVCVGSSVSLSNTTSGGSWTSGTTTIATVASATGLVTGAAAGTTSITYSLPTGCKVSRTETVNPLANAGTISGTTHQCMGATVTLTHVGAAGIWSSGNTAVATIGSSSGVVSGVAGGTATISYAVTNICNTDFATVIDTIIDLPAPGTITGADSVCAGDTIHLADIAPAGSWSSDNTAVATVSTAGIVTGVSAGSATISYTVSTPCGNASATLSLIVRSVASCHVLVSPLTGVVSINIYPNPSNGTFQIELPGSEEKTTVTIIDALGKIVENRTTENTASEKMTFDLRNVPSGSYMVKVMSGSTIYRGKIEVIK